MQAQERMAEVLQLIEGAEADLFEDTPDWLEAGRVIKDVEKLQGYLDRWLAGKHGGERNPESPTYSGEDGPVGKWGTTPTPRILESFSRTDPESVEAGDFSETGWIDEEGYEIEPDPEYDETIVSLAVEHLRDKGAFDASSSRFHLGIWYSTGWEVVDYGTGEEEERSYHLKGFTPEEEQKIYDELQREE